MRPRITKDEYAAILAMREGGQMQGSKSTAGKVSRGSSDANSSRAATPRRGRAVPSSGPFTDAQGDATAPSSGPFGSAYDEHVEATTIRPRRLGVISDLHVPIHDSEACNLAVSYLKAQEIDTLVINGDFVDMYSLTRHGKDSRKYGLQYELATARRELLALRQYFGDGVQMYYVEGNHENWWKRYMRNVARELDEYHGLDEALLLRGLGIHWVDHGMGLRAGKLRIIHGHEISGSGVYVAKRKLNKAKTNILFGHHHTSQEWTETNLDGHEIGSWAIGCLCQRTPEWNRFSGYTLGFAYVEFSDGGDFEVHNKRIIDGVIR